MDVINVLPLTPETMWVLDAEAFARMRRDAILIRIGRGEHVVKADMLATLDAGRPAMAGLDVARVEPWPKNGSLWTHPRVMLTPYAARTDSDAGVARSVAKGIVDRTREYCEVKRRDHHDRQGN